MLARARTEGLVMLGCVDLGEAHLDRLRWRGSGRVAARGQRVAVGDADDEAEQGGGDGHVRAGGVTDRTRAELCPGTLSPAAATCAPPRLVQRICVPPIRVNH